MTNFFFIRDRNSPSNLASIKNDFVSGNADERLVSFIAASVSSRAFTLTFTLTERERDRERQRETETEEVRGLCQLQSIHPNGESESG